jgi:hypothetical protein
MHLDLPRPSKELISHHTELEVITQPICKLWTAEIWPLPWQWHQLDIINPLPRPWIPKLINH